ncbi:hypothetical protein [Actinotalea sp. K2]|uniref:hypothetical protein n=1 Tax=Actinotalea sp. K2 TaxID=2939438 RepID=UPI002016F7DD|nr:hypothetical protein [Actinotalea sp. K2]MCL3861676.1 hypothetical protein [Actinotalea sp. K2]
MTDLEQARVAKAHLRTALQGCHGIGAVGVAPTADGYCLQVNVSDEGDREAVPDTIDGVDVRVRVVGPIRASG